MFTWVLRWWWRRKVKKNTSDFKVKNETNSLKATCVNRILQISKRYLRTAEDLYDKITRRIKARDKHYIIRDIAGNEIVLKHPIFTQSEISEISKTIRKYYFTIILFVVFETLLWLFAADAFFPELPNTAKYIISFILGIGLMLLVEKGFGSLAEYKEALILNLNGKMDDSYFTKYKSKRITGYALIVIAMIVIIGLGIARIVLLTPTDSSLFTIEEFERLKFFNVIAPLALSILSIGIAIYMGSSKLDQSRFKIKYDAYKNWKTHNKKTNRHIIQLRSIIVKLNSIINDSIEMYWQLVIDLKRIYAMEFDEQFKDLYQEYVEEKRTPGFCVTEDIYRKYDDIQSADQLLFNFGIRNNEQIVPIFRNMEKFKKIIEEVDKEYKTTINNDSMQTQKLNQGAI